MRLTDQEKQEIKKLLDAGQPLPDRYRFTPFREPHEAELFWPGKTHEVTNVVLPFQSIEQVDEPRAETAATGADLFTLDRITGRQSGGWTNKLIWGDNKLVLSSLKNGPLRREVEDAGGLKLVYIDPPFDVGADFSMNVEVGEEDLVTKEPSVIEDLAYRDTWGQGKNSYLAMITERLSLIRDLMASDGMIYVHCDTMIGAYVRVAMDEIFGQQNFLNSISWRRTTTKNDYRQGAALFPRILVIEVDRDNKSKDLQKLDIEFPRLTARIEREYKNLAALDPATFGNKTIKVKQFSPEQQREIIFTDLDTGERSHITRMDVEFTPTYQNVIGFFARTIMRDLRLVGGQDILFGKIKSFIQDRLFDRSVDLDDLNILRNLSEIEATRTIIETFKKAINELTVVDRGSTEIRDRIKLSQVRPYAVKQQGYVAAKKSIFNKTVGDSNLELEFAGFLDNCPDVISFAKNGRSMNPSLFIEYRNADGSISNYYPDFLVKTSEKEVWIVETKGREDLDDPLKWDRLNTWVADATAQRDGVVYRAMLVREEDWINSL